jgi:uncharacterized membrane protein
MYQTLISYHNLMRWFVLASLILAIYRAYRGYVTKAIFSKTDNTIRHWTATIAHIQLMIGMTLYFHSPIVKYFMQHFKEAISRLEMTFFSLIHSTLMLVAIVLITIGSAKSKRQTTDSEKFRTMLVWFSVSLLLIFMAIPWPFSPFSHRPYFR